MGLISKTSITKWNAKNKKWYEVKKYIYTKIGDNFEVSIEDLKHGSSAFVDIKCDGCGEILKNIKWGNYLRYVHGDNKYYCHDCALKLFGKEKRIKTLLKKGISFEQWCVENNRQDVLDRWDYDLNNYKPNEVTYSSSGNNEGYWFKCPKGIHKSELKNISSFTNGQEGSIKCNQCNSFAQYLIDLYGENALNLYWDYEKNTLSPWEIDKGSLKNVFIKCNVVKYHESYNICCHEFIKGGRCSYCNSNGKVHPLDSLGKLLEDKGLLDLWSKKNKKSPYKYTLSSKKIVWWECINKKHDDYQRDIGSSNRFNFRCPECIRERDESFLQEKVRLYLESLKIGIILHETKCTIIPINPKTKYQLPFDNEVVELKLIIEVMGIQHYQIGGFHILSANHNNTTPKQELHYQKLKDRYKRYVAYKKGYNYIEIPYWTDDKNETWKQLINNKINEIQKVN